MGFESVTPVTPLDKGVGGKRKKTIEIKVGEEKIKNIKSLENTQLGNIGESDMPTRKLTIKELTKQEGRLAEIREEIKKEKGVSDIGVEATVISGQDMDESLADHSDGGLEGETELDRIIISKTPSIEDIKIEEERFMTSLADKLSGLAKKPPISSKQFDEIANRSVSFANKIEILLNNFFPGMNEIAALSTGQRENLYKSIKSAMSESQGAEMLMSGEDLGKKIKEIDQRYATEGLRLFEHLKLGQVKIFKDKNGKEQKGIKYTTDVNIRLENYPEIK